MYLAVAAKKREEEAWLLNSSGTCRRHSVSLVDLCTHTGADLPGSKMPLAVAFIIGKVHKAPGELTALLREPERSRLLQSAKRASVGSSSRKATLKDGASKSARSHRHSSPPLSLQTTLMAELQLDGDDPTGAVHALRTKRTAALAAASTLHNLAELHAHDFVQSLLADNSSIPAGTTMRAWIKRLGYEKSKDCMFQPSAARSSR